jgi:hypothetical protein
LRSQLLAAGCVISFNDAAQRLAASLSAPPAPAPPAPPPPPAIKLSAGSLTAADLAEPWYGVDPRAHKLRKRG